MLKIGQLKIHGDAKWPKSRVAMKKELRSFAGTLGLDLRFVVRKKSDLSWCQIATSKATVCEGIGGKLWPMEDVMFFALHEISHWIQYNEGMFQKYFGMPYYGGWAPAQVSDQLRLGLRAERHADRMARRLALELFGAYLIQGSIYDKEHEEAARALLKRHLTRP